MLGGVANYKTAASREKGEAHIPETVTAEPPPESLSCYDVFEC